MLITGAGGFVGPYLAAHLRALPDDIEVVATSRAGGHHPAIGPLAKLDVDSAEAVSSFVDEKKPTHVVHLAGWAAVPLAAANWQATWQTHLFGTLNVARALMSKAPECVLLHVGSGQVYGATALAGGRLDEESLLAPMDTYTASKAAADLALGALARQGLRCVRLRPFNHTGPGQTDDFVVPSFARQIARIRAGTQAPVIRVGNLDVERDFLDVRDVVSAYSLAMLKSASLPEACILNISSGQAQSIRSILDKLIQYGGVPVTVESDDSRQRSGEIATFVGDSTKARRLLDWAPQHRFDETLRDVFSWACDATRRQDG